MELGWAVGVDATKGESGRTVCLHLVKGVSTPRRLHYRVHGKSRVYKLMHVKSLEQNRPVCIMERNRVREARRAVSGLGAALRASSMSGTEVGRGQRSACDVINRYDVYGRGVEVQDRIE